jgi:hypothetical protein
MSIAFNPKPPILAVSAEGKINTIYKYLSQPNIFGAIMAYKL